MRILIIRHGDPDYVNDTLTEKGEREAKLLAEYLKNEPIDKMYVSPLGRARKTASYTEQIKNTTAEVKEWLKEFSYPFTLPNGKVESNIWDVKPVDLALFPQAYDRNEWINLPMFSSSDVPKKYKEVVKGLDEVIEKHGYKRKGDDYETLRENRDTVAFFCHFGLESMLLSHLLNISPMIIGSHFCASTTSVTTLYTEERDEGIAKFRMLSFGEVTHLTIGKEKPSFSARFCETFHSEERH